MNIIKKEISTQEWIPFGRILENGIIISKNSYIKIIKVIPINYDLKSNLEKESVLNSYKLFLKTCDFDIQILIQSKKENLSKQISKLEKLNINNDKIKKIAESYVQFIKEKNDENKASTKAFYIIIRNNFETKIKEDEKFLVNQNLIFQNLSECYFKIKETLSRCGNIVYDINSKKEIQIILKSFLNPNYEKN